MCGMGFLEFAAWFTAPPLNPTCSLLTVAARAFECHLPRHLMAVAILLGKARKWCVVEVDRSGGKRETASGLCLEQ
jgi:hypothetical protein